MMISTIKHKNDTSADLYLYLGTKTQSHKDQFGHDDHHDNDENLIYEEKQLMKVLALISTKINERFKNLLTAFRYFDTDHLLTLTLNEFAQGIEHLRIKISFENVKKVFNYIDQAGEGEITF